MQHHGNVTGHQLAQGVAVRTVDLAVGLEVDVFAARNAVDAHGSRQPFAVKEHIVTLHFFHPQRIGRQAFIAIVINGDAAGENVLIPALDLERDENRQDQYNESECKSRHHGHAQVRAHEQAADQEIHDHGEYDRILHADIGDQNKPAGKRAENRAHGIGGIGTTNAAADAIEALSKQSRHQWKSHAQEYRGNEHHQRRQKYLEIKKHRKGIAEAVQQSNKNQWQSLEQWDGRQRRQADPELDQTKRAQARFPIAREPARK